MATELSVTIVGAGALGTVLAKALHAAGVKVEEIVYRSAGSQRRAKTVARSIGARVVRFDDFASYARPTGRERPFSHRVIWLCVGDTAISLTASAMAERNSWKGAVVFHSSGAFPSDELKVLRRQGAKVASAHPMMTFVRSAPSSMRMVAFALEGDAAAVVVARRLIKALGGYAFALAKRNKPLYHALGAFTSPLIIAQMAAAERIGRELGLKPEQTRKIVSPILQQTIRNYLKHGPAAAFSGPIVRGDAATVAKNLAALKRVRGAEEVYRALAKVAVEELPSKDARAVKKIIG